ncbi:MAG: purine-nucleoside phosphorylase [Candidatus Eremiobacteraeota bacterium]|nr:purine-nucleoside phosphorylase [Candidatus Eremiobacteraeota bacterium]
MENLRKRVNESLAFIKSRTGFSPQFGMILGSGLGELADEVEAVAKIPYAEIPHFPVSTVAGHEGILILGTLEGRPVVVQKGRTHFYEGYPMEKVTFSVRLMKALGVHTLVVTNAAGGINPQFRAGELMLIADHINLTGTSPLVGPNDPELGPRFPDLSRAYTPELRELAKEVASKIGIQLREGIFVGLHGPNYETPAELRFMRQIGGDAVGMSTVPEVIVAAHSSLNVLGISCITNVFIPGKGADHEEVLQAAEMVKPVFKSLIRSVLKEIKEVARNEAL